MSGRPFQSKLEPHFDFILEARRKRQTWQAIGQELAVKGIAITPQAVYGFAKRRLKRRYPLGAAPAAPRPAAQVAPSQSKSSWPEIPEFSEIPPPASDAGPDPLTLPPKKKSKWNQI
jgi:hypothetical protein